jgi:hypothetical protein
MKKISYCLLLLLGCWQTNWAQQAEREHNICGNGKIDTAAERLAANYLNANRENSPLAVNRLIRVYFYIVANSDGSNAAATPAQIQAEFQQLVTDYAPYNWCFANMGFRYIFDTNINFNINCDNPVSYAALNPWLVPNCVTIFYQRQLGANGGGTYGGNAYAIPNTYCSVATGNINLWRTISHEVGHCLGLRHTFEPVSGLENINGNNCSTTGDLVCDTPADPFGRGSCFSSSGCSYTGNCVDGNGATNFNPPYNNIMSYWGGRGCAVTNFSTGQYNRANSFVSTNSGLISTLSGGGSTVYGPATFNSTYGMISVVNQLSTTGSILCQNNCVVGFVGQRVVLNPGFTASPTTGKVEIRAAACNY